jgi:hypothetical protein
MRNNLRSPQVSLRRLNPLRPVSHRSSGYHRLLSFINLPPRLFFSDFRLIYVLILFADV